MPSVWANAVRGSVRTAVKISIGSPNRKRSTSRWWMLMLSSVSRS